MIIRHAPARHEGRLCGRTDVPAQLGDPALWQPLKALVAEVPHRICSPALRCRQTATTLWPEAEIPTDPRLWEQDFGAHDGLPFGELPDLGEMMPEDLSRHCPPGGESFSDMVSRVRPALDELMETASTEGTVVVIAHAGTVRAALAVALRSVAPALSFEVAPWSVTRFRVCARGLSVIATNWRPL